MSRTFSIFFVIFTNFRVDKIFEIKYNKIKFIVIGEHIMLDFLAENWGSIAVGAVILAAVVFAVVRLIKNKRAGKGSCCGDCSKCSSCLSGKNNSK